MITFLILEVTKKMMGVVKMTVVKVAVKIKAGEHSSRFNDFFNFF